MGEIGVTDLKTSAPSVIEEVERGAAYVITKRGRAVAVLLPVEGAEDLVLANADEYLGVRQEARGAYARGGTTTPYLPPRRIRALVIGVPREGDRIFVERGTDEVKAETFYRPLGGEIEFGESAADALRREFMEEIRAEVEVGRRLGCLESRFTYRGAPGHEIVLVHEVRVLEPELTDSVVVREAGGEEATCRWIALEEVRRGDLILYPPGLLELLDDNPAAGTGVTR